MPDYTGEPPAADTGENIHLGRYRFRVVYRHAGNDEGITIHVFGPVADKDEEIVRFDCFRRQPHYHLGWSYRDEPFTKIYADDCVEWAMSQIEKNFVSLLERAGADALTTTELARHANTAAILRLRVDDVQWLFSR